MRWPSFFTKKSVSETIVPSTDIKPAELTGLEKSDTDPLPHSEIKKSCDCKPVACAPVSCACAPVTCSPVSGCHCVPVTCAPVTCAPVASVPVASVPVASAPVTWCVPSRMGCCKAVPQSLVLRSTSPPESEKLTTVA